MTVANSATAWRLELARKIAAAYAVNPKVAAVMVAGSTGRGTADRFSDLELDVYWREPPDETDRSEAVRLAGAELLGLYEDEDEWEEQMSFNNFHAATSAFAVDTVERFLREVLAEHKTSPPAQMRLYSLLHAAPIYGAALTNGWREQATHYPHELALAMLRENLDFDGFGYAEAMLAARDDLIMLFDIFVRIERQILGALLGLNKLYLPNPGFKSMDELIGEMALKPDDLARRLKEAFRLPNNEAVAALHIVIDEVFSLVAEHAPELNLTAYREQMAARRGVWDAAP